MRRAALAPVAVAVMEPSGAERASSYHRLRALAGGGRRYPAGVAQRPGDRRADGVAQG